MKILPILLLHDDEFAFLIESDMPDSLFIKRSNE